MDVWLHDGLGIVGLPTPYGAPNANAICERFIGSLRREALSHFIFLSEGHLRRVLNGYVRYFNAHRTHQGIDGVPDEGPGLPRVACLPGANEPLEVEVEEFLGGLHRDYRLAS